MSQTLHQIYQNKAIVLARTMVVKFHSIAEAINKSLIDQGYDVDPDNPASWKYYMNMFGEYHQADLDRLSALSGGKTQYIQIKIAGETHAVDANFTKELLYGEDADLAVANEYRFNTHYYKALIAKYPEFEDLILGVLNPVSPTISIPANEGEILYCGGYLKTLMSGGIYHYVRQDYGPISENFLIESNEENLITILQEYIYSYLARWWNANYAVTNDLFHANFMGLMMLTIPQILGNIRYGNAKTGQAHSFHIREHLESYGNLGWVSEYLSKGVLLWLYRNMIWLNANRGKAKVFDALIDNVLTPTNIPISGYRLRHDVDSMSDEMLLPDVFLEKEPLNYQTSSFNRSEILDIINAEVQLATENHYDQEGQAKETRDTSRFSLYDNLNTKVLESTVVDMSNHMAITKEDIGLNLWCYSASHGFYRGSVIFTNPLTNERMQLTPLNAYILAFYCFNMGWANYQFDEIPDMYARLILRHPTNTPGEAFPRRPTLADVKKGVLKRFITDEQIKRVLGDFVPDYTHSSSASFAAEVNRSHTEAMRKYNETARLEDAQARGFGEWIAHQCYWYDIPCPLTKVKTKYSDWLTIHGIDFDGFSRADYITLGLRIVEAATGVDLESSEKLRNRQSATLAILKHFSSYTIQIIQNTVASDSYWLDWKTLRITNDRAKVRAGIQAKVPLFGVKEFWSISEGPIWLQSISDKNTVRVRDSLVQSDVVKNGYDVQGIRMHQAERAKMPLYTVTEARIPDVYIETRVKKYATLTSMIYPVGITESMTVTDTVAPLIEVIPTLLPLAEDIKTTAKVNKTLFISPPKSAIKEVLDVGMTYGDTLFITPPNPYVLENLNTTIRANSTMTLLAPSGGVIENLDVGLSVSDIQLLPQNTIVVDEMEATIGIDPVITLEDPSSPILEVMDVNMSINDTIVVTTGHKETMVDNANLRFGLKEVHLDTLSTIEAPTSVVVDKLPKLKAPSSIQVSKLSDVVAAPTNLTVTRVTSTDEPNEEG